MGLISEGIEKVRAYALPAGIFEDGKIIETPAAVLVKWYSGWSDKFYQIYVNGRLADVTTSRQQRQMIVHLPQSLKTAVRIEVFAVEAQQANIDFSDELDQPAASSGRVKITLLRSQNLPTGSTINIYSDNSSGEINYDSPLNAMPLQIWPARQDKAGLGMSKFGVGDFGYDGAAAVGFGKGVFSFVEFGFDADKFEWTSLQLEAGVYKFAVKVSDKLGNESITEAEPVAIIPAAAGAGKLGVNSFDKQTNQLILNIY